MFSPELRTGNVLFIDIVGYSSRKVYCPIILPDFINLVAKLLKKADRNESSQD